MKKVLLVKPPCQDGGYVDYEYAKMGLPVRVPSSPYYLAQIAGLVQGVDGAELEVLDAQRRGWDMERCLAAIESAAPDLLIAPLHLSLLTRDRALLETRAPTLGVLFARTLPHGEVIERYGLKAAAFLGRGWQFSALLRLVEDVVAGRPPAVDARGLALPGSFAGAPAPDWGAVDLDWYLERIETLSGQRALTIRTYSDCPHRCAFCANAVPKGETIDFLPETYVRAAVRAAVDGFGVDHVRFMDPAFSLRRERALQILAALREDHPSLTFTVTERVDTIDEAQLVALQAHGVVEIGVGIESPDPVVQKEVNKEFDTEAAVRLFRFAHRQGLRMTAYLTLGLPGETETTLRLMKQFIRRIHPQPCSFSSLYLTPASALYRRHRDRGELRHDDWERYFTATELIAPHTHYGSAAAVAAALARMQRYARRLQLPGRIRLGLQNPRRLAAYLKRRLLGGD